MLRKDNNRSTKSKQQIDWYFSSYNFNDLLYISPLPNMMNDCFYSCQITLSHKRYIRDVCRNVLDKLCVSKVVDSLNRLSIVAEQPFHNPIMLNILRPGVLRQYYGMDIGVVKNDTISRAYQWIQKSFGYQSR